MRRLKCCGLMLTAWLFAASVALAQRDPPAPPQPTGGHAAAATAAGAWIGDLAAAAKQSLRTGQPILIKFGGQGCPWCRKLDAEMQQPAVQHDLGRWTRVALDVDLHAESARKFHVGPIPALRVLTPRGRLIASHDGFLPADQLAAWLEAQHSKAASSPDMALSGEGPPEPADLAKLIAALGHAEITLREAAIRRLLPHPDVVLPEVLAALQQGNLATRLSCLELLESWKAPVDGLDPWMPTTINQPRLDLLAAWRDKREAASGQLAAALTEEELASARSDLARLVSATSGDVEGIRERLSRYGVRLLPEVYRQLQQTTADIERERLVALRLRLVASPQRVINWPGGLERLAASDAKERHRAADELVKLANAKDEPLLLELFSDPDPLVREISLRGLKELSGAQSKGALIKLLADPDPNVKAAVLKQLAESPSEKLVPQISDYLSKETDPDLLVHAIRVLREVKNQSIRKPLLAVMSHESWQVRSEALEALAKTFEYSYSPSSATQRDAAEVQQQFVRSLSDVDGFVVAKAMTGLRESRADLPEAAEPLANVAETHPQLAATAIETLIAFSAMREKALPQIRSFTRHADAAVRAAAIAGLCEAAPQEVQHELLAAVGDEARLVRIAAAKGAFQILKGLRNSAAVNGASTANPYAPNPPPPNPFNAPEPIRQPVVQATNDESPDRLKRDHQSPWDKWLLEIRGGKHRDAWFGELVAPLMTMIAAEELEERLTASLALVPLGKHEPALATLHEIARQQPVLIGEAAKALPWLPWPERHDFVQQLLQARPPAEAAGELIDELMTIKDDRALPVLWGMLDELATDELANSVQAALKQGYYGDRYYNKNEIKAVDRERLQRAARASMDKHNRWKSVVALTLLADSEGAMAEASSLARQLAFDEQTNPALRVDAFQIHLLASDSAEEAAQTAVAALSQPNPKFRKLGLTFLTNGPSEMQLLDDSGYYLDLNDSSGHINFNSQAESILPKPPAGLKAEAIEPLLAGKDQEAAALARSLLVLMDKPGHLAPLIDYWQQQQKQEATWRRLVYRAIAYADDTTRLPLLREIYASLEPEEVREFYWTIRIMRGPELLQFREQIRKDVGMDALR